MRLLALGALFFAAACGAFGAEVGEVTPPEDLPEAGVDPARADAAAQPDTGVAPAADAGPDAPAAPPVVVLRSKSAEVHDNTEVTVPLGPSSGAGNLLVVVVANGDGLGGVQAIADEAGNEYVSAGTRSVASCTLPFAVDLVGEVWFAKNAKPGAKNVTVAMTQTTSFSAWVIEAAGLSTSAPLQTIQAADHEVGRMPNAPKVAPRRAGALVVSMACTCGFSDLQPATGGPAFTHLTPHIAHRAAYLVTSDTAPYGASWTTPSTSGFNAMTAVFVP